MIHLLNFFNNKNTNIIDYKQLFFECDPELIKRYKLTTEEVKKYTEDNIKLVEDYIKKDDSRSLNSMMDFTFWSKDTNNFLKFLILHKVLEPEKFGVAKIKKNKTNNIFRLNERAY